MGGILGEGVDRDLNEFSAPSQFAVALDKMARIKVVRVIAGELHAAHPNGEVGAEFQVEMGSIHAAIGADPAELIAPSNALAFFHTDEIEVGIERIHIFHFTGCRFQISVADNHAVAPSFSGVAGENNKPVAHGVNGIAQVAVAAAFAIPILAKMAVGTIAAIDVIPFSIRFPNGIIKAVRQRHPSGARTGRRQSGGEKGEGQKSKNATHV